MEKDGTKQTKRATQRRGVRRAFLRYRSKLRRLSPLVLAVTVFLGNVLVTPPLRAQSFAAGEAKYQAGDLIGAEATLKNVLKTNLSRAERIKTYKLLGLTQYLLGKRTLAQANFKGALALDPKLTITPQETLDESVIPFFNNLKKPAAAPSKKIAAAPKASPPKASPPKPAPPKVKAPPPVAPSTNKTAAGMPKKAKQTLLKVLSNAAGANVSVDGILAGQVNSFINTDPGNVSVEVSSTGYTTRRVTVAVTRDQTTTVTVNLVKPQPKVAPKPAPRQGTAIAARKPNGPSGKRPRPYAPKPADDLFGEADGPLAPGPRNGGPAPAGGPDLATQFQMDSGSAYPNYGTPPMGAYPYAPPQPMYYGPPAPQYYAAPAPMMAPPPPPAPPPVDPGYGAATADPYATAPADPAASDPLPGGKKEKSTFIAILPFGIGQFQNNNTLLGLAFLGAEAAAIYYWQSETQAGTDAKKQADTFIQTNCQFNGDTGSGVYTREECESYQANAQSYVDTKTRNAYIGLGAFGALWVAGAIEAVIHDGPAKAKPKKKRRLRGLSLLDDQYEERVATRSDAATLQLAWDIVIAPADPTSDATTPGATLVLGWEF